MCSDKQNVGGYVISCGSCNECISTKTNDWVCRASAEATRWTYTQVLHLTYNNSETSKDGSVVFFYAHIKGFMKRVRSYLFRQYGIRNAIRYIVCGEQGSKKGRVHWHVIIYTNENIMQSGKLFDFGSGDAIEDRSLSGLYDRRLSWSLWPYGFIMLQKPDQDGLRYVLKYAFKDQFNIVKSRGTGREAKAENYSSGFFRMSKNPAIGFSWLEDKMDWYESQGAVPTTLGLKIDGYSGYWWPRRQFLDFMLDRIYEIDQGHLREHGKHCAQFGALVGSLQKYQTIQERLQNGKISWDEAEAQISASQASTSSAEKSDRRGDYVKKRCGQLYACALCTASAGSEDYRKQIEFVETKVKEAGGCSKTAERRFRKTQRCNPFCNCLGSADKKKYFRQ